MAELGMAGFRSRPFKDDDPLVCACGTTLGTRLLEKKGNEAQLAYTLEQHAPDHRRRLAHQNFHRGPATDCPECGK